jgi:uncharacterized protein YndB with AHSA1/START domain
MMAHEKFLVMCASAAALVSMGTQRAAAEVVSVAGNGFEVRETAHTAAPPDKVYAAILAPARWWSSEHTFSASASNLTLDARVGGCWCETLPQGGSVEHLRVIYLAPGKTLRLRGALGPFQAFAVDGVMTLSVKGVAGGTDISLTYALSGYIKDGFDELSKAADQVLGEQVGRLGKLVDTDSAPRGR